MENQKRVPVVPLDGKTIPVYPDRKYAASENYILRSIAGEHVLVCVGDNEKLGNSMLTLNETCAFLWRIYQQPLTYAEALAKVNAEYEASAGIIARDVQAFIVQSVQLGLLVET